MKELNDKEIMILADKFNIKINGIFNKDKLPNKFSDGWYILNLDDYKGGGTHWTCFRVLGNDKIYFDSFGFIAPEYLDKMLKPYTYNKKEIQDINTSSCGWFCLQCIIYCSNSVHDAKTTFNNFIKNYGDNTMMNEHLLSRYFS